MKRIFGIILLMASASSFAQTMIIDAKTLPSLKGQTVLVEIPKDDVETKMFVDALKANLTFVTIGETKTHSEIKKLRSDNKKLPYITLKKLISQSTSSSKVSEDGAIVSIRYEDGKKNIK